MLLLKDIKGQHDPVRYLRGSISSGRISASYLFSGPSGVGRALTAKAFLRELLFSSGFEGEGIGRYNDELGKFDKMEHPDVKWIIPEKNKSIGIDEIRLIKDTLYMKPFSASSNAAVIEDAHMMTQEAANALLKVLEEPPDHSIIILISDKKEWIPPTVLSRCSEVRFSPLPGGVVRDIIMDRSGADEQTADLLAGFSQGSVGKALEWQGSDFAERRKALADMVKSFTFSPHDVLMNWHSESKDVLVEDIDTLIAMLRDAALANEGIPGSLLHWETIDGTSGWPVQQKNADEIYGTMERLTEIKRAIAGNCNTKIVSQVLPFLLSEV
ncbi:MAG: AAA family ATPase [Candidatus Omnitrophota bacterium]